MSLATTLDLANSATETQHAKPATRHTSPQSRHTTELPRPPWLHSVRTNVTLPAALTVLDPPLVPTCDGRTVDYANFDHAASTPPLRAVTEAVDAVCANYSSVHRGQGWASRVTSHLYEAARAEVAAFVGARPDDTAIFTRNTTDSMGLLAHALPRRTHVVVFASEHHATLLPWDQRRTTRLPVPITHTDAEALLTDALARRRGNGPTLVVIGGASNVTGEYAPIDRLAQIARASGARVALDAAQVVSHRALNIAASSIDYVAFSGHKIYAPFGAGVLVGRTDWLDAATPYLRGGGASKTVGATSTTWRTGPARHEGGTPNVVGAVALAAACAALRTHRDALLAHESVLSDRLLTELAAVEGVRIHTIFGDGGERAPVVAFTIDGLEPGLVSAALSAEHGIGVRDGKFCAHPLVDHLLAEEDSTTAVRASAGLATTPEHVDRLVAAVAQLAARGPRFTYSHDDVTGWVPEHDQRPLHLPVPW